MILLKKLSKLIFIYLLLSLHFKVEASDSNISFNIIAKINVIKSNSILLSDYEVNNLTDQSSIWSGINDDGNFFYKPWFTVDNLENVFICDAITSKIKIFKNGIYNNSIPCIFPSKIFSDSQMLAVIPTILGVNIFKDISFQNNDTIFNEYETRGFLRDSTIYSVKFYKNKCIILSSYKDIENFICQLITFGDSINDFHEKTIIDNIQSDTDKKYIDIKNDLLYLFLYNSYNNYINIYDLNGNFQQSVIKKFEEMGEYFIGIYDKYFLTYGYSDNNWVLYKTKLNSDEYSKYNLNSIISMTGLEETESIDYGGYSEKLPIIRICKSSNGNTYIGIFGTSAIFIGKLILPI